MQKHWNINFKEFGDDKLNKDASVEEGMETEKKRK